MGSLFGSKQKQSSTTTTNPFSGQYKDWADQAGSYVMGNMGKTGTPYTGQLSAPINASLQGIFGSMGNYTNNQNLSDYASGKYLDPTTNPYVQAGYNAGVENLMKQFGQIDDRIKSVFNSNGLFNSSMRINTQNKNAADTKKAISDFTNNYYSDLYKQGVQDMLNANSTQNSNLNTALQAGITQQQLLQNEMDKQYSEWLRQQGVSDDSIANVLNYLSLVRNPSQTTNTTQKTSGLFNK